MKKLKVSIIITSYNDNEFLDGVLKDLKIQEFPISNLEILVLEAGNYSIERAKKNLGLKSKKLKFFNIKNLPRTTALNYLVSISKHELIIRLDARTKIYKKYLKDIVELAEEKVEANVGGILLPVGKNDKQIQIANIMKSPFFFGNGEFRRENFKGYVNSIYLGSFRKSLMIKEPWFDEKNVLISEDSDLNYRILKSGGKIYLDSKIKVKHYCRESKYELLKLCFNYGIGRGLFFRKHNNFSAIRQLIPPLTLIFSVFLFIFGFYTVMSHKILLILICIYLILMSFSSFKLKPKTVFLFFDNISIFVFGHITWALGFFIGVLKFKK